MTDSTKCACAEELVKLFLRIGFSAKEVLLLELEHSVGTLKRSCRQLFVFRSRKEWNRTDHTHRYRWLNRQTRDVTL